MSFLRDVAFVSGGTAFAQVFSLAILPLISRLYSPEDFGLYTLYLSMVLYLSLCCSADFESAIVIPDKDTEANRIFTSVLRFAPAVALMFCIVALVLMFGLGKDQFYGLPWWIIVLAIPAGAIGSVWHRAYRYLWIRHTRFSFVGKAMVASTVASGVVILGSGWLLKNSEFTYVGLIAGQLVLWFSMYLIFRRGLQKDPQVPAEQLRMSAPEVLSTLKTWRNLLAALFASNGLYRIYERLPIFAFSIMYGNAVLGFYGMAERAVQAPGILIANAIGDVYRQRAARAWNDNGNYSRLFLRTLLMTTVTAVPLYVVAILLAPDVAAWVLGEQWREAGEFASILLVASMFGFMTTPMDKGSIIVGAHVYLVSWHVMRMVLKSIAFIWCYLTDAPVETALWSLVVVRVFAFAVDVCFQYRMSTGRYKPATSNTSST